MKVLIFAGRKHHKEKLQNVYNELLKRSHRPTWLICNNAINIDPSSEFIANSGDQFIHVYHYLQPEDARQINDIVENTSFSPDEFSDTIAPFWSVYSLREAAELLVAFRKVIEIQKPDAICILHSNNFFAKILAYIGKEEGVKVFAFQEGLLRDRDQDTMNKQASSGEYCTHIFCWSQEDKRKYVAAGLKNKQLKIGGPLHLDNYFKMKKSDALRAIGLQENVQLLLFAPPIASEYIGDVFDDISFLANIAKKFNSALLLKPHPFEVHLYSNLQINNLIVYTGDPYVAIKASGMIIGQHSTIMTEALILGLPVIEFNSTDQDILQPMSADKIALPANRDNIIDVLQQEHNVENIQKYIKKNFSNLGNATEQVVKYIERSTKFT